MTVLDDTPSYPRVTTVGDFFALLKPRVMSLVVFTGLAGIVVAPGHVHLLTAFTALLVPSPPPPTARSFLMTRSLPACSSRVLSNPGMPSYLKVLAAHK